MIPLNAPWLGPDEERRVVEALRSGWVTTGPAVAEFEERMRGMTGRRYAVATSSGTSALEAALVGLRLGPGRRVLAQAYTCDAVANAVLRVTHAPPIVSDIELETWSLDGRLAVEALRGREISAVIVAHTYGPMARDLAEIARACAGRALLIEDASEAHGSLGPNGARAGATGEAAVFSCRGEKSVSGGQLGVVVTDDAAVARRATQYAHNGLPASRVRFWSTMAAGNAQPSHLNAALVCAQLARFDELRAARQRVHEGWEHRLTRAFPGVVLQGGAGTPCWWLTAVLLTPQCTQLLPQDIAVALAERGIESRTAFYGLHHLPHCRAWPAPVCPVSDGLMTRLLIVPSGPTITSQQQDEVVAHLAEILGTT